MRKERTRHRSMNTIPHQAAPLSPIWIASIASWSCPSAVLASYYPFSTYSQSGPDTSQPEHVTPLQRPFRSVQIWEVWPWTFSLTPHLSRTTVSWRDAIPCPPRHSLLKLRFQVIQLPSKWKAIWTAKSQKVNLSVIFLEKILKTPQDKAKLFTIMGNLI